MAVVQANNLLEDQSQIESGSLCTSESGPCGTFVGIYDGHVGPETSHYINDHMFDHLKNNLIAEGSVPEEEILSVVSVPSGKMGLVIGKKGASILSIKESCNAEIVIGGSKGPPDKVFVIGTAKEVRKAEAILRGRLLPIR